MELLNSISTVPHLGEVPAEANGANPPPAAAHHQEPAPPEPFGAL